MIRREQREGIEVMRPHRSPGSKLQAPRPLSRRSAPLGMGARGLGGFAGDLARKTFQGEKLGLSIDLLRLTLVLLVIFAVSRVQDQYPILAIMRQLVLIGLLVGLLAFANPREIKPRNLISAWPSRVMIGLAIMACLSVPFGLSIGASGKAVLLGYSKVLVGAFLLIVGTRNVRDLYTLVTGFMLGSAMLVLLAFFVFRTTAMGDAGMARIATGGAYSFDANDLGTMASAGIAVSLLLVVAGRGVTGIIAGMTALGLVAAIARTGSRGGFLGLLGLGLGLVILARDIRLWKRVTLLAVAAGGLFLAAPARYWEQMGTIASPEDDYNWTAPSGRVEVWKRGLKYMLSYPLTGVGVSNFPLAEGTISPAAKKYVSGMTGIKWMAPHNSFIEAGAEMGLPGLALFSVLVLGGVVGMVRLRGKLPARWRQGTDAQRFLLHAPSYLALAMVGFAVAGFFVSFAYLDLVYILGAFMSGTYVCSRQMLEADAAAMRNSFLEKPLVSR